MRRNLKLFVLFFVFVSAPAYAQYMDDDDSLDEDWGMYLDDEDVDKTVRKVYNNAVNVQYGATQFFGVNEDGALYFNALNFGYFRSFQILDEKPYFVEGGATASYLWGTSKKADNYMFALRVPVSVMYKWYLAKKKDVALAPYAGAYFRAIVAGKSDGWNTCQLGWHVGLRFYRDNFYLGVSYSRDFPDKSKSPDVHQCCVHLGYCF